MYVEPYMDIYRATKRDKDPQVSLDHLKEVCMYACMHVYM